MSLQSILEKPAFRKHFYIVFLLSLALLITVRQFALSRWVPSAGEWGPFAVRLVDGLISSAIVTVAIGSMLFLFTPKVMRRSQVEVIMPAEIGQTFDQALLASPTWWYKGNCGRYFRAVSLPRMAAQARKKSRSADVIVLVIDPEDAGACRHYATYRSGLGSASKDSPWTLERVRTEALATVLSVLATRESEPMMRIQLGLTPVFSSFRLDLSSEHVVLTKEDKLAPAVRCAASTFFYEAYKDEIVLAYSQSRQVHGSGGCPPIAELDVETARSVLGSVGIAATSLSDGEIASAIKLAKDAKNPYA